MAIDKKQDVPVLKLRDRFSEPNAESDAMTMFRIWSLLSGAPCLRDTTVGDRILR